MAATLVVTALPARRQAVLVVPVWQAMAEVVRLAWLDQAGAVAVVAVRVKGWLDRLPAP
jgi:hypothetical protein